MLAPRTNRAIRALLPAVLAGVLFAPSPVRAIVAEPALVLADEPTANLDSATGASLMDLMRGLNESKRITFVFSTHDPMVRERARRTVRLKDGRVVG